MAPLRWLRENSWVSRSSAAGQRDQGAHRARAPAAEPSVSGVRLSILVQLLDEATALSRWDGPARPWLAPPSRRAAGQPLTTADVWLEVILPRIEHSAAPFSHLVPALSRGPAQALVSHAWECPFADLVAACDAAAELGDDPLLHLELLELPLRAPRAQRRPAGWWTDGLRRALGKVRCLLVVAAPAAPQQDAGGGAGARSAPPCELPVLAHRGPWIEPAALARARCLFEIATAAEAGARVLLLLPPPAERGFRSSLSGLYTMSSPSPLGGHYGAACRALADGASLEAAHARPPAWPEDDDEAGDVIDAARARPGGLVAADARVRVAVRRWLATVSALALEREGAADALRAARVTTALLDAGELAAASRLCAHTVAALREPPPTRAEASSPVAAVLRLAHVARGRGHDAEARALADAALAHVHCALGPAHERALGASASVAAIFRATRASIELSV
ncbi:hypothetical protein KFE25_004159 [Diacronema lutheri]|uniref:Uncharacterized protein n=1 Tax=Diacronema lutheri TaxID=2081491 RepID=A0A8J6C7B7_DIALT|nr:hypothetical protein KFE25_004159 [Diacronema lutheri]